MDKYFEIRRKAIHIFLGVLISFLIYYNSFSISLWIGIFFIGVIFAFILKKKEGLLSLKTLLLFEREDEIKNIHFRGSLAFILGSILSYILFSKMIAILAISALIIGDSFVALYGTYFGKIKSPWSAKHFDATILGIFLNSFFISFFIPFWQGFLAISIALIFENLFPYHKIKNSLLRFISDDNILLPLIVGTILTLLI